MKSDSLGWIMLEHFDCYLRGCHFLLLPRLLLHVLRLRMRRRHLHKLIWLHLKLMIVCNIELRSIVRIIHHMATSILKQSRCLLSCVTWICVNILHLMSIESAVLLCSHHLRFFIGLSSIRNSHLRHELVSLDCLIRGKLGGLFINHDHVSLLLVLDVFRLLLGSNIACMGRKQLERLSTLLNVFVLQSFKLVKVY